MGDDLRRKLILKQMSRAKAVLAGASKSEEDESADTIGDLPSVGHTRTSSEDLSHECRDPESCENTSTSWGDFFSKNEIVKIDHRNFSFNTYYTLPKPEDAASIPVFIFHHGAGSSALTFANLSRHLCDKLEGKCATFAFDARGHGQTRPIDNSKEVKYDLDSFVSDFVAVTEEFYCKKLSPVKTKLSLILVGHSLGGSICTSSYINFSAYLQKSILGVAMLDIVEEAAILALAKVDQFLLHTPNVFRNYQEAIDWHVQHGLSRNRNSAEIAIPALFHRTKSQKLVRITNLRDFGKYWDTWFQGLSHRFVSLPISKLLLLAGNENLDKELIVGQMQGKYQLVVFQDSGHFIQEDTPAKTAITLVDFYRRNDSKNLIIKSNWGSKK